MPRANRRCTRNGCDQLAPCAEHARPAWAGSDRRASLPSDWQAIRRAVLDRDPACQLAYAGTWHTSRGATTCAGTSVEVDHIGDRNDHQLANLRGVCSPCHGRRTAQQSAAGQLAGPATRSPVR